MNKRNWLIVTTMAILLLIVFLPAMASADQTLTVTKSGNGSVASASSDNATALSWNGNIGTLTASPGAVVTLTATADTGYIFAGWGGDCSGTGPSCRLTMTADKNVTATFQAAANVNTILTITKVTSDSTVNKGSVDLTLSCDSNVAPCTRGNLLWSNNVGTITFDNSGWIATLTATPDTGYIIDGWNVNGSTDNPDCSKGSGTCRLTMTESKNVIVTFKQAPIVQTSLTVTKVGKGSITASYVTPTVSGPITFSWSGDTGTTVFDNSGAIVTIVATPNTGYNFVGWGGDCGGTGNCVVQMTSNKSVTATFAAIPNVTTILTVTKKGFDSNGNANDKYANGSIMGTYTTAVGSGPILFTWGVDPSGNTVSNVTYDNSGTVVMLTASPDTGYTFDGWDGDNGDCSGTGTCTVTMTENRSVIAKFKQTPQLAKTVMNVTKIGKGSITGTYPTPLKIVDVVFSWTGIPPSASVVFDNSGIIVTLVAAADTGYTFSGWSGHCSGTSSCIVTMTENKNITATFSSNNPVKLTVFKTGSGTGTVTANTVNLAWSGNFGTASCDPNDPVTLTATPADSNSIFTGWSGDKCDGNITNPPTPSTQCIITMSSIKNVTATFKSTVPAILTLTKAGLGTGNVTTSPGTLNWSGNTGTTQYDADTNVTLTATPDSGSVFTGWSGSCTGTNTTCTLTMSAAKNVTATFVPLGTLTVTKAGTGAGTVIASPTDLTWNGNIGTATYASGTSITLTATPDSASIFTGWSGGLCSGTSKTCTVSMSTSLSVTATFNHQYTLTVTKAGNAAATSKVTISPGTLTWNGNIGSAIYNEGDSVTLTATVPNGSTFTGWSGGCTGTVLTCTLNVYSVTNITATFVVGYQLTVTKSGSGTGAVTASPGNLALIGNTATAIYNSGVPVTLTATPDAGSTFTGWGGDCTGTGPTCSVAMLTAKSVTATFDSIGGSSKKAPYDFNGDGNSDLLWRNAVTGDVYIWFMSGTTITGGNFAAKGVPKDWNINAAGDFDGDGKSDILWQNTTTGDVYIWLMDGTTIKGGAYVTRGIPGEWVLTALGDFNGDGKTDIMWRNSNSGDIYIWLMNGTSIDSSAYIARGVTSDWVVKAVADLNGDGKSDVVWQNTKTNDVAAWLMNGLSITTGNYVSLGVPSNWQIKAVEDFNGDGKADIAWQETSSGDIYLWLMNGLDITSSGYAVRNIQPNWQFKTTGDYRGKGKTDMLWQNSSTGDVYIWFMDGLNVTGGGYAAIGLSNDWQVK
ncbi:MAG: VCBS repeat-containing protein [Nitrospirae bacterium]|nr:VCBS repeat-containing protein [Nitrospirota bacterium]